MGDVHTLPGVIRPDLEEVVGVEVPLAAALSANLRDVVVVGRSISGRVGVWFSHVDSDAAAGLAQRGVSMLTSADIEPDDPVDTDGA